VGTVGHNTQPWRFAVGSSWIDIHADDSRRLAVADQDGREMIISCGAALYTARRPGTVTTLWRAVIVPG
jgi:hypothetical protein